MLPIFYLIEVKLRHNPIWHQFVWDSQLIPRKPRQLQLAALHWHWQSNEFLLSLHLFNTIHLNNYYMSITSCHVYLLSIDEFSSLLRGCSPVPLQRCHWRPMALLPSSFTVTERSDIARRHFTQHFHPDIKAIVCELRLTERSQSSNSASAIDISCMALHRYLHHTIKMKIKSWFNTRNKMSVSVSPFHFSQTLLKTSQQYFTPRFELFSHCFAKQSELDIFLPAPWGRQGRYHWHINIRGYVTNIW